MTKDETDRLARWLRAMRKTYDLSLDDIATVLGLSRAALSLWELGRSRPTGDHLRRIRKFYSILSDRL